MIARVKKRTELEVKNIDRSLSISQSLKVNQEWKMIDKGEFAILSRNGVRMRIEKSLFNQYFEEIQKE